MSNKIKLGCACLLIIIYVLAGCATEKRIEKKADKSTSYLLKNGRLASVCSLYYPAKDTTIVKDSLHFDTLYVEGEDVYLRDTITIAGQPVFVSKKCPPNTIITKYIRKDSLIIRRDYAAEKALESRIRTHENDYAVLSADNERLKAGRNWWRIACLITWAVCAVFIGFKLFKR